MFCRRSENLQCCWKCFSLSPSSIKTWILSILKLSLNISKCQVVTYTKKLVSIRFEYTIHTNVIERSRIVKDLYVIFDYNLSFRNHIATKITESLKTYGYISRNCKQFRNIKSLRTEIRKHYMEFLSSLQHKRNREGF